MRVLLVSPLLPLDPPCGDTTYTAELLASPPDGVEYEDYGSALRAGRLIERGVRGGPASTGDIAWRVTRRVLAAGARHDITFWEPLRFFTVRPGAYDLIHCHIFSCRFSRPSPPVVLSNATPPDDLYRVARGWSSRRFGLARTIDTSVATIAGVSQSSYRPAADRLIAFSEWLKTFYVARGWPTDAIDVIPPFTRVVPQRPDRSMSRPVVAFVAKDLNGKGGDIVLSAFARVRAVVPEAELWIAGPQPGPEAAGVRWLGFIDRERLLNEVFARASVFAYPTRFDGLPLVAVEALAAGVPIATTNYRAMPEVVGFGRAGVVTPPNDVSAFAEAVIGLLDPATNARMRDAAREHYEGHFSPHVVRKALQVSYEKAIATHR
jgi:glycosyltransferase involved in cell wall biosynthesis